MPDQENIANEVTKWFSDVWVPELIFKDIFESKELTDWGKGGIKFDLVFQSKKHKMRFSKAMKITLKCDFHFENYVGTDISIVQE